MGDFNEALLPIGSPLPVAGAYYVPRFTGSFSKSASLSVSRLHKQQRKSSNHVVGGTVVCNIEEC